MQKEESLQQHYEFDCQSDSVYTFTTINDITYAVIFKPTPYLFGEDSIFSHYTYEFIIQVIENPTRKNPAFDKAIPPTIASIFTDFYENASDTITIYICDSSDNRQQVRQRKFDQWFEFYRGERFIKINAQFSETDGTTYPVSLIIKKNNPFRVQIFEEFIAVVEGFNSDK